MTKDSKVNESLVKQGVKMDIQFPICISFGGMFETMIKAAKRTIIAILGNADVTDEELMTAFTRAESLINSRPLTYQSANPDDTTPLTPKSDGWNVCTRSRLRNMLGTIQRSDGEEYKS